MEGSTEVANESVGVSEGTGKERKMSLGPRTETTTDERSQWVQPTLKEPRLLSLMDQTIAKVRMMAMKKAVTMPLKLRMGHPMALSCGRLTGWLNGRSGRFGWSKRRFRG